jgi:hypothetical protein
MYDADFKEITLHCPADNCFGVNINLSDGKMFYIETTQASEKKLKS